MRYEQSDREFRDFIESILVTHEELAAIVSMPELSIPQVKRHLRHGKGDRMQKTPLCARRGADAEAVSAQQRNC